MTTFQTESRSISSLLRDAAVLALPACNSQPEPTPPAAPQRYIVRAEDLLIFRTREVRRRMR